MPLIFISSESQSARRSLAEELAKKLGLECLCREDLIYKATQEGIPVGKLEVAMVKSPHLSERLARQKERYIAFITSELCERAAKGDFVYHGRAGHMLLQGISQILKVRLVVDSETRVAEAMERLKLDRAKAVEYIKNIDEDIDRWVRYFYEVRRDDPSQYDVVVNVENMSLANAASMLCYVSDLPDFRPTPASLKELENRRLEMRARRKLALDQRTADADLKARAENGVLTVTYMPRQPDVAKVVPEVLEGLEGCTEVMCTMASTNILWVQERFDPACEALHQLNEVAQRWDAAIEMVRFVVPSGLEDMIGGAYVDVDRAAGEPVADTPGVAAVARSAQEYNGGIEDDVEPAATQDDGGLGTTSEALVNLGRSGGYRTIEGNFHTLLSAIRRDVEYSLIVLGDSFLSKSHETQMRLTRELAGYLQERIGIPVVTTNELKTKYLIGKKQFLKTGLCAAAVAIIYFLIFHFQEPIMGYLGATEVVSQKIIRMAAIFVIVPGVAYLYSTVTHMVLKLMRFE